MKKCSVITCERKHASFGFCHTHYMRVRKFGTPMVDKPIATSKRGSSNPKWKGGKTHDGHGRVMIRRPDHPNANSWGYVYRYRIAMEEKLGRVIGTHEVIHHIDGNPSNDEIANLELMNQGDHARRHINDMHNEKWLSANLSRNRDSSGRYT